MKFERCLFFCVLFISCLKIFGQSVPECGKRIETNPVKRSLLLVGGNEVRSLYKWPWMVAIRMEIGNGKTRFICGGSLISKKHILTAAHCFGRDGISKPLSQFRVVLGSLKQNLEEDISSESGSNEVQILTPYKVRIHSGFTYPNNENDLAVLLLKNEVKINDKIHPICLPELHQRRLDQGYVFFAGWGAPSADEDHSEFLQEATFKIVPIDRCRMIFRRVPTFRESITEKMICAGDIRKRKDACEGDSGGPLILYDEERSVYIQVGISAFGYSCAEEGYPGLYVRVGGYLNWIESAIKQMN